MTTAKLMIIGLIALASIHEAVGHGFMYYPWTWNDRKQIDPAQGLQGAQFGWPYSQPEVHCDVNKGEHCAGNVGYAADFFTNDTFIPGEPTLPEDMFAHGRRSAKRNGTKLYHPWNAPGTAFVHGEGCGANGGNPYPKGCLVNGGDTAPYGTCCGFGKGGCGGYVGGHSALEHYAEGTFVKVPTTKWKRGEPADVYWASSAHHQGGYAYRLCKVPDGDVTKVTEKCFQDGHLSFFGKKAWVYKGMLDVLNGAPFDPKKWKTIDAVRVETGTHPPNSEWQKISVEHNKPRGWGFKDQVMVPATLEAGDYILSFRWDCQRSAQIWNTCANIQIV